MIELDHRRRPHALVLTYPMRQIGKSGQGRGAKLESEPPDADRAGAQRGAQAARRNGQCGDRDRTPLPAVRAALAEVTEARILSGLHFRHSMTDGAPWAGGSPAGPPARCVVPERQAGAGWSDQARELAGARLEG
jgi:hypothetical protein